MIKIREYRKWLWDEGTCLKSIGINYCPRKKEKYLKNGYFDMECPISDHRYYAETLNSVFNEDNNDVFSVQLYCKEFKWLQSSIMRNSPKYIEIKRYLDGIKWRAKKYVGRFQIKDLKNFLRIFIDYPMVYSYQDVLIFSRRKDFMLVLSDHGTIWVISPDVKYLYDRGRILDSKGITVLEEKISYMPASLQLN